MLGPIASRSAFVLSLGFSCSVYAHESPHATGVGMDAAAAKGLVAVLTNRGLVTLTEGKWSVRCNEAYGVNTAASVVLLGRDTVAGWTLATPSSVLSSIDGGCQWADQSPAPSEPLSAALATPSGWYVARGYGSTAPALHFRPSEGGAWSTVWTSEDDAWINSLVQAPGNPERLYATFERPDWATKQLEILWGASSDGGHSWSRRAVDDAWLVVGAHPDASDVVFVQYQVTEQEHVLLRSADGGESFAEVTRGPSPFGALSRGQGGELWLAGGARGGLLSSADEGKSFTRIHDELTSVRCLVSHGGALYACANTFEQGEGVYRLDDDGAWERVFSFQQVSSATACAEELVCRVPWLHWQNEVGAAGGPSAEQDTEHAGSDPEAHEHGAGDDDATDAAERPTNMTTASCSVPAWSPKRPQLQLWLTILLGALGLRRQRRHPRRFD